MTDGMTKVEMQKSGQFAEIYRNRDGREGGGRDFSGEACERCDPQTNERKKKTETPVPHWK